MSKADLVIISNAIFTGLSDTTFPGGIATTGNKIVAVGSHKEISEWIGPQTNVIEYGDQMIMPGFIDAHMHFFDGAFAFSKYMLQLSGARSEAECVQLVDEFAKNNPDLNRITGFGWFMSSWEKSDKLPTRSSLDAIIPDMPVVLQSADGHTAWLNTKALEEGNFTKDTKMACGAIGKDVNGELDGLIYEIEALAYVFEKAYVLPDDIMKDVLKDFSAEHKKYGITSTTSLSLSPVPETAHGKFEVLAQIEKEGDLPLRLHLYPSLGIDKNLEVAKGLREKYQSDKFQVAGLKQYIDGVTSTYTGYLLQPYSDNPKTAGSTNYPAELYKKCIANANKEGFGVRLHAIGDAAVRLSLDAFEESNLKNDNSCIRNCIEHLENVHPDDLPRFKNLGVIASVQPIHLILDGNEKVSRIGEDRCKYAWPFRKLLDQGAMLAFGTDFPVAEINPFPNIYSAVTRCDSKGKLAGINPQEKISLYEALKAYTYSSACVISRENELGTLEAGKLADIIVLNKNLFEVPNEQILNTKVVLTVVDGQIVYKQ